MWLYVDDNDNLIKGECLNIQNTKFLNKQLKNKFLLLKNLLKLSFVIVKGQFDSIFNRQSPCRRSIQNKAAKYRNLLQVAKNRNFFKTSPIQVNSKITYHNDYEAVLFNWIIPLLKSKEPQTQLQISRSDPKTEIKSLLPSY